MGEYFFFIDLFVLFFICLVFCLGKGIGTEGERDIQECEVMWIGGEPGRRWRKGKHDQNVLYKRNLN